jgi:hypothetical protein
MEIDKKILDETIHCTNEFECLKNENYICIITKVGHCIDGKVHFVNCNKVCNYSMSVGGSTICNCPTRKEIYNKYKK